jgi:hypothetical protein
MKEQFIAYLKSIGMEELLIERVAEIYQFYDNLLNTNLNDEILDIFITDYITKEETREYENAWFFSKKYFMEARLFINEDDFDVNTISKELYYLRIKKENYDFLKSNEKSRLYIKFHAYQKGTGEIKASKENCDYLKKIYIKYLLPNLDA